MFHIVQKNYLKKVAYPSKIYYYTSSQTLTFYILQINYFKLSSTSFKDVILYIISDNILSDANITPTSQIHVPFMSLPTVEHEKV
jgi:hypothetical protein